MPLSSPSGLPLVVQLSFAGSRYLFDAEAYPDIDAEQFHAAVRQHLSERLGRLPVELGLRDRHFFCAHSQLAIGADTLFTQACRDLHWPQRFLLPQQREDFLNAKGAGGKADFDDAQQQQARELFNSPHVIQERVVSDAADRHTRFNDVNLELVRLSDVVVCLVDAAAAIGKSGGTHELMVDAQHRQRPLLEIRVRVDEAGTPGFSEQWHHRKNFCPPGLPGELSGLQTELTGIPATGDYCKRLKDFASSKAKQHQTLFKNAALFIIGTHVAATGLAVAGLTLHEAGFLPVMVGVECLLLVSGFMIHQYLHHSHAAQVWALARLLAEIARSVTALREAPGYLTYLFNLPLPASLRPLLCTLNVLHLRDTRTFSAAWDKRRDNYIMSRFDHLGSGQIAYFKGKLKSARFWHTLASGAFLISSFCAILATLCELLMAFHVLPLPETWHHGLETTLGPLAILLPVIAVAALSLAASFDLEARAHTYREMLDFLREQKKHLNNATSESAFCRLALETETRLLGENAGWYSRRAFTGVA
jgi:hypothetical protein